MAYDNIVSECSFNPYSNMPLCLIEAILEPGVNEDKEVAQFLKDIYFVDDWRKCRIPECLKPYIDEE